MDIDEPMDSQATEFPESQPSSLTFSQSLVRTSKPLKVGELTALLKNLHEKLKELDQNVEQDSLATVSEELVHKQLIKNNNKTIRALVACCLADIIRLHAPTCPYTMDQLRSIFTLFVDQLSQFGTETPDFQYHFYLLENLQSVKTFLLLNEMDNADELVLPMIENFFKVTEKATLARNVELCMTDVLIQLIEDVRILGPELTELILEQFDKFEKVI
ncbi:hypothetical protein BD770DRAFT_210053 [Pilaira anomala]|nr:hypothetical protein BD770DRAFT_210053 [Pilaira anomala]